MVSCGGSDDVSSGLPGVPTGEIVSVELRQQTLTGFSSRGATNQKWWTHEVSNFDFNNVDCGDDDTLNNQGYIAFYPDGSLYQRYSTAGTAFKTGDWAWTDSGKSAIRLTRQGESAVFTVTWLNDDNVVYGSNQSAGSCSVITYEKFGNPYFD